MLSGNAATNKFDDGAETVANTEPRFLDNPVSPLTPSEFDWDALYEEEEEEEQVDMKSHGSVITHLLSQVSLSVNDDSVRLKRLHLHISHRNH